MSPRLRQAVIAIGIVIACGGMVMNAFVREEGHLLHNETNRRLLSYLSANNLLDTSGKWLMVEQYNGVLSVQSKAFSVTYYHQIAPEDLAYKEKQIADGELIDAALVRAGEAVMLYWPAKAETTAILERFDPAAGAEDRETIRRILRWDAGFPLRQHRSFIAHHTLLDPRGWLISLIEPPSYPFRWLAANMAAAGPVWERVMESYVIVWLGGIIALAGAAMPAARHFRK